MTSALSILRDSGFSEPTTNCHSLSSSSYEDFLFIPPSSNANNVTPPPPPIPQLSPHSSVPPPLPPKTAGNVTEMDEDSSKCVLPRWNIDEKNAGACRKRIEFKQFSTHKLQRIRNGREVKSWRIIRYRN